MDNLESLKAKAERAEKEYIEAQREAQEAERKLKAEKELAQRILKVAKAREEYTAHAEKIVAELKAVGFTEARYEYKEDTNVTPEIEIDDDKWTRVVSFEQIWSGYRYTNQYRVRVGSYGSTRSFPLRKDGTYNYKAIAQALVEYEAQKMAARQRGEEDRERVRTNVEIASRLRNQFGLKDYGSIWGVESSKYTKGKVTISFNKSMTEEEAVAFFNALKSVGINFSE